MTPLTHPLKPAVPGTAPVLTSLHYGPRTSGRKVLVQASLHADEVPGMLVAHHLRGRLDLLEAQGRLRSEIVLVPAANPVGLGQWLLRHHVGRFELTSGENFNREYARLTDTVAEAVQHQLTDDPAHNLQRVRAALREAVAALPQPNLLASLRRTLLGLAVDADLVLDLHCDGQALMHLYTTPSSWPALRDLAACLGAEVVLLAERSGGEPFDEACSMTWPELAQRFGEARPIPVGCAATTVELRGEADVDHGLAAQDAQAILHFLSLSGHLQDPDVAGRPAPALRCEPTPLAGSMPIVTPTGGVLVFVRTPGERVREGEAIAEVVDPYTGEVTVLVTPVDGLFFARENRRWAVAGMSVGKVAGTQARRQGPLLSA